MTDTGELPTNNEQNAPPMTLGARLTNIFIAPSEVFDDIKGRPHQAANWLVPLIGAIIGGIIYTMVIFSQPQIIQGMHEIQEKQMQTMVDQGKLTRKQADAGLAISEQWTSPAAMKAMGSIMSVIATSVSYALVALLLWAVGTLVFKAEFDYGKAIEIVGLAGMIGIVDHILRLLLGIIYSNIYINPGLVLLVAHHFNPQNKVHMMLSWFDFLAFWQIVLWSLGLARLTNQSFLKSFLWIFGIVAIIGGTCAGTAFFLSSFASHMGGK